VLRLFLESAPIKTKTHHKSKRVSIHRCMVPRSILQSTPFTMNDEDQKRGLSLDNQIVFNMNELRTEFVGIQSKDVHTLIFKI
jgi:hypothetical protein